MRLTRKAARRRHSSPASIFVSATMGLFVLVICAFGLGTTLRTAMAAAPEPSPRPPRWELEFKMVHDLRLIELEGDYYWFMTYMVTNRTGEDQTFVPTAILYTDAGDITTDGDVSFNVTQSLLELLDNPLLESKTEIIGPLLQGRENAREGLLIWPAAAMDIDQVSVFVAGLSSETQVAINPYSGEETVVRKTLALEYDVPGDPLGNIQQPVSFAAKRWIMR